MSLDQTGRYALAANYDGGSIAVFALKPDEIDVLVHPQSVVHGLVEFRDGSVVAQLGSPDMRIPIAHCLAWPQDRYHRRTLDSAQDQLQWAWLQWIDI